MNLHNFKVDKIDGSEMDLSTLKGKKVLLVNTASECGLTPQFSVLEEMYEAFGNENFTIIGFPSNDFGAQDPGTNSEILSFCTKNYGVTFPMMAKVKILGEDAHPIYKWLQSESGVEVKWNFHKFLINENGELEKVIDPAVSPADPVIIDWIQNV